MIEDGGIIAGLRGQFPPTVALQVCQTLLDEDIDVFEFTMNSVEPLAALQLVKAELGEEVVCGMGTVMSLDEAKAALDAGANFVMSPILQPEVVEFVESQNVMCVPGVMTATEAMLGWSLGVRLLKLFPVGPVGVEYFRALSAPLDPLRFSCHGATTDENAHEFILAGAVSVGMGSWLTGDGSWTESKLRSRARILVNAVASAQEVLYEADRND